MVTGNDTDPAYVKANTGVDGTDKLGMLWRINGASRPCGRALIFSRLCGGCMVVLKTLSLSSCRRRHLLEGREHDPDGRARGPHERRGA